MTSRTWLGLIWYAPRSEEMNTSNLFCPTCSNTRLVRSLYGEKKEIVREQVTHVVRSNQLGGSFPGQLWNLNLASQELVAAGPLLPRLGDNIALAANWADWPAVLGKWAAAGYCIVNSTKQCIVDYLHKKLPSCSPPQPPALMSRHCVTCLHVFLSLSAF